MPLLPSRFWKRDDKNTAPTPGSPEPTGEPTAEAAPLEEAEASTANSSAPLTASTTTLRDRLTVTWAVPEERVRPHLPAGILPDRLPGADGALMAFVQVEYALHEAPKLARLPKFAGKLVPSFYQVTYRILTRRPSNGKQVAGSFEVRTFVSVSETHITKRIAQHQADFARFTVFVDGDPARGTYRLMRIRAGGDLGVTQLEVRAGSEPGPVPPPFAAHEDLTRFLARREEVLFRASLPKNRIGLVPLVAPSLEANTKVPSARLGSLVSARCTPWMDLRILSAGELMAPLHITLEAEASVQSMPPRLMKKDAEA